MPEQVVIPLSKRKLALLFGGSLLFVVMGLWLLQVADEQRLWNPLVAKGAGLAGVAFFGICFASGVWKLFDRSPGLVVDRIGLVDNSSGISAGRIPWSEITGISVTTVKPLPLLKAQRFLTIHVRDPQAYVARGNALKRMMKRANYRMFGSPIHISAVALKTSFEDLVELVTQYHSRYVSECTHADPTSAGR